MARGESEGRVECKKKCPARAAKDPKEFPIYRAIFFSLSSLPFGALEIGLIEWSPNHRNEIDLDIVYGPYFSFIPSKVIARSGCARVFVPLSILIQ